MLYLLINFINLMFKLSYIISTYNRLTFLQITLAKLLENVDQFDEIVIVDGNSNDGTKEYLQKLFDDGRIHQYVSEPDRNQAHGWNKGMLLAKGLIIKKIIDDDVFDYNSIRKCKDYMLSNPDVDLVISNDLSTSIFNPKGINKNSRLNQFNNWVNGKSKSFTFGDVHMLIRKSSLSFLGLYNTSYMMMDWEYALRISYLKANITYFTGYNALSVAHPNTITSTQTRKIVENQSKKALIFYDYEGDQAEIHYWSKIKIFIGKILFVRKFNKNSNQQDTIYDIEQIYKLLYESILNINSTENPVFINPKKN